MPSPPLLPSAQPSSTRRAGRDSTASRLPRRTAGRVHPGRDRRAAGAFRCRLRPRLHCPGSSTRHPPRRSRALLLVAGRRSVVLVAERCALRPARQQPVPAFVAPHVALGVVNALDHAGILSTLAPSSSRPHFFRRYSATFAASSSASRYGSLSSGLSRGRSFPQPGHL